MDFIFFSILIVALILTVVIPIRNHRRADRARVEPMPPIVKVSAQELAARIRAIGVTDEAIDVFDEQGFLHARWNLDAERDHVEPHQDSPEKTYMVQMQIKDHEVLVRYAEGVIHWEPKRSDSSRPSAFIDWEWPLTPIAGPEPSAGPWLPEGRRNGHRSLSGLVEPLRKVVLAAGFAWQPVLEMIPAERRTSGRGRNARTPRPLSR